MTSKIRFDPTITLGNLLTCFIIAGSLVSAYVSMQVRLANVEQTTAIHTKAIVELSDNVKRETSDLKQAITAYVNAQNLKDK